MEKVLCLAAALGMALGGGLGSKGLKQLGPGSTPCSSGWRSFNGNCYLFGPNERMIWSEAVTRCSSMGSTLVTITSEDEMRFLRDTIMQNYQYDFWVGLTDEGSEGIWRNIDGTMPYLRWGEGQPDNYGGENCGEIEAAVNYYLNDGRCYNGYSNSFICKQRMTGPFPLSFKIPYIKGGFICSSKTGFEGSGTTCQDINECAMRTDDCDSNADCDNTVGNFSCTCKNGFTGNGTSCHDIDECRMGAGDCDRNADCYNTKGGFICSCKTGFEGNGTTCQDINECALRTDDCDANADCNNTAGNFTCICKNGFTENGTSCRDIDECTMRTANCDSNAVCNNTKGGFICSCNAGFEGNGTTCQGDLLLNASPSIASAFTTVVAVTGLGLVLPEFI